MSMVKIQECKFKDQNKVIDTIVVLQEKILTMYTDRGPVLDSVLCAVRNSRSTYLMRIMMVMLFARTAQEAYRLLKMRFNFKDFSKYQLPGLPSLCRLHVNSSSYAHYMI